MRSELFVNGESQGVRTKGKDDFHVVWRVKNEPGVVKVVSRKDGKRYWRRRPIQPENQHRYA